jgi:hypothetical protein
VYHSRPRAPLAKSIHRGLSRVPSMIAGRALISVSVGQCACSAPRCWHRSILARLPLSSSKPAGGRPYPGLLRGAKHGEMVSLWPRHGCPKGSGRSCRRCASRRRPRLGVGDRRKAGSRHVLAPDCALLGCAVSNRRLFLENNPRERVSGLWPSLGWSRLSVGRRGGSFMAGLPSQRTDGNPDTLHSPPFMSSAPSRSPGAAYQCQGFGAALPIPAKLADTPCSSDRTPPDPAASRPA